VDLQKTKEKNQWHLRLGKEPNAKIKEF